MSTLTYELWIELETTLLGAYDRTGLTRLLQYKFNFRLDENFPNEGLAATVFRLIDKTNRERWLLELIVAASEDRPKNANLRELVHKLRSGVSEASPSPTPSVTPPASTGEFLPIGVSLESLLFERRIRDLSHKSMAPHLQQTRIQGPQDLAPFHEIFRLLVDSSSGLAGSANIIWDLAQFVSDSRSPYPLRIDGPPGTGKTTLLNLLYLALLARRHSGGGELVPVLLDCRRYSAPSHGLVQQDIEVIRSFLTAAPGSQLVLLIDGVDEYIPAADASENALLQFVSAETLTRKLVGVSVRYAKHYPGTRVPVIESGEEEKRIVLGGVRTNSPDEEKFLRAFFALPGEKSDAGWEERVRHTLKLHSFRLEQLDLMTVSLVASKLRPKNGKYHSARNLSEFYALYCSEWMASRPGATQAEILRAAEMAFDYAVRGQLPEGVDFIHDHRWRLIHSHETIKDYLVAQHVTESIRALVVEPRKLERLDYVYPKTISRFFEEMMQRDNFTATRLLKTTEALFKAIDDGQLPESYTKLRSVLCFMLGRLKHDPVIPLALAFLKDWIPKVEAELSHEGNSSPSDRKEQTNTRQQNLLLQRTMYVSRIYLKEDSASDEYIEKLLQDHAWCSLNRGFHLEYYGDIPYEPSEYMLHDDDGLKEWTCTYHYLHNKARTTFEKKNSGYEDLVLYTLFSLAQHRHALAPIDEERRKALLSLGNTALTRARIHSPKLRAYLKMMLHNLEHLSFPPAMALEQMYHLKFELRRGWVKRGLKHPESVADHSYGACLLCLTMLPDTPWEGWEAYDKQKVLSLLFAHDFIEAYTGDFLPQEKSNETERHEERSVEYLAMLGTYPDIRGASSLASLWLEFRNKTTDDALVANDIDKLENLVQLFMLRSGRAAFPVWTLPSRLASGGDPHSGASSGRNFPDFEDFRNDLLNKIRTAPGHHLRELITKAFDSEVS